MPTDSVVHQLAIRVSNRLRDERLMLVTAESCTGGHGDGAHDRHRRQQSDVVERGFVTYSNAAKCRAARRAARRPDRPHGAVSEAGWRADGRGAFATSGAQVSLSIAAGIAGAGGGTDDRPGRDGLVRLERPAAVRRWKRRTCSRAATSRSASRPPRTRSASTSTRCSTSVNIDPRFQAGRRCLIRARTAGRTDPPLRSEAAS